MGFSVRNNISGLMAETNVNSNQSMLDKSLERLSSGYRINHAADDAAGLSISDRLTSQITGLNQAARNGGNAQSMLQTAEGGIEQVTNMLQRIRELAVQGGNGDLTATDRGSINTEMQQLQSQINNIATSTQFNGLSLLNGSLQSQVAASSAFTTGVNFAAGGSVTVASIDASSAHGGRDYTITNAAGVLTMTDGTTTGTVTATSLAAEGNEVLDFGAVGVKVTLAIGTAGMTGANIGANLNNAVLSLANGSGSVDFQVGANNAADNRVTVGFTDMQLTTTNASANLAALRTALDTFNVSQTALNSQALMGAVDNALVTIDSQRATLGAQQNRVDYAVANLNTTSENLTAAQSRIRDVDVAAESANLSRATVLVQAGVSVLAQANQMPQLALKLLG